MEMEMFTDRPGMTPMTEDQIERHVERKVDRLDAAFMAGRLTQTEYNEGHREIARWADVEYRFRRTAA